MKDSPLSGAPSDFDKSILNALIHDDPLQSIRKLTSIMDYDQSTIVHIQKLCVVAICFEEKKSARQHLCPFADSSSFTSTTSTLLLHNCY